MACFQLSSSSICGPSFASVWLGPSFQSEAAFNAYVTNGLNPQVLAGRFACPPALENQLSSVVYQISYFCSLAAVQSEVTCGAQNPIDVGLCMPVCNQAAASLEAVLTQSQCDAILTTNGFNTISADCQKISTDGDPNTCWPGAQAETGACGFSNLQLACALPMNSNSPCCLGHTPAPTTTDPSPQVPTSSSVGVPAVSSVPSLTLDPSNGLSDPTANDTTNLGNSTAQQPNLNRNTTDLSAKNSSIAVNATLNTTQSSQIGQSSPGPAGIIALTVLSLPFFAAIASIIWRYSKQRGSSPSSPNVDDQVRKSWNRKSDSIASSPGAIYQPKESDPETPTFETFQKQERTVISATGRKFLVKPAEEISRIPRETSQAPRETFQATRRPSDIPRGQVGVNGKMVAVPALEIRTPDRSYKSFVTK